MKKNEFLKKIRLDNGLSRSKIAKILDVSPVTIERYENNKLPINPELKYVQGICALYGYNPNIFNYNEINDNLLDKYRLNDKEKKEMEKDIVKITLKYEIKKLIENSDIDKLKKIISVLKDEAYFVKSENEIIDLCIEYMQKIKKIKNEL